MITLRRLAPDDWAVFRDLRLASLRDAPEAFETPLADWLHADERRWRRRLTDVPYTMCAEWEGRPAGVVCGTAPDEAGEVELISLWVAPAVRGHGVGNALVRAVLRWAADQGARQVRLEVRETNTHAAALYRRHGFRPQGRYLVRPV
ncbi:Acetyltransferase (GNAT) family protein [Amycolatopsis sacchari]|uniref:Acetyltransferase (GNAT) family protein n=1 Tax=Amycolatopsis sacchari TaxID=115433 RepID=A0A1I3KHD1_9PSEU|nr:GNAT family N-acetyltransferase [Amycolatopsis sacchari]SFI71698.1 Acetyltransferase (GNAT) family protein [Amycolatopsis sacchari]